MILRGLGNKWLVKMNTNPKYSQMLACALPDVSALALSLVCTYYINIPPLK